MMRMIEIYDMQDVNEGGTQADNPNAKDKLDITPQLAAAACNVIRCYCKKTEKCEDCKLKYICRDYFVRSPDTWPEVEGQDV